MKMFNFNLVLLALLAVSASAQATVVGRVLIAAGDAYAIRNGQELRMATGSPVEEKDTLKTGPASNMQVRFNDESIVSLRDQSLLKIEDYKFSGKQDGFEKAFFNLLKGGFRTVTGLIGKVNKTNYAVKTPTATIGIRGTNYALLICSAGSCGPNAKDGVYGGVSGGIISHTNSKGEYQFGSADYFYSSGLDAEPQKLIGPPSFLGDQLTGQKRGGKPGGSEQAQNGGAESDGRPNKIAQPTPQQDFIVTENRLSSGAPALLSSSTSGFSTGVSIGKAAAFAYTGLILGVIPICELGSGINSNVAVDASGRLIAYDLSPSPARSISIGRFDAFSTPDPAAGNLTVARWAGATAVDSSGALQGPVFIHTVAADFATSVPTSGSVVFSTLIAATNPTNSLGMTGSFGSASVNVDFSLQQVAILSLNFGVGGITYALNSGSTPGTFSPSNPQGNGSLTGTCSGGLCSTGLNAALGKFAFVLAGPTTVSGIGVSYTARSALLPLPLAAGAFALK